MKMCSKCRKEKLTSEFFYRDKPTGKLHAQCKECYRTVRRVSYRSHYDKYKDHYRYRAKERRAQQKSIFRKNMLDVLSGKSCAICEEDDIRTLEFDHIDPTGKSFSISQAYRLGHKWEDVLKEMNKCRILCANCHRKHTSLQFGWYKAGLQK